MSMRTEQVAQRISQALETLKSLDATEKTTGEYEIEILELCNEIQRLQNELSVKKLQGYTINKSQNTIHHQRVNLAKLIRENKILYRALYSAAGPSRAAQYTNEAFNELGATQEYAEADTRIHQKIERYKNDKLAEASR